MVHQPDSFRTISPIDGELVAERTYATPTQLDTCLERARHSAASWRRTPLRQRLQLLSDMVDAFEAKQAVIATELTRQMGRPSRFAKGEVGGFVSRARTMLALAPGALADIQPEPIAGFERFIRREPWGLVLVLSPWNYPLPPPSPPPLRRSPLPRRSPALRRPCY